jgi:hypothetical protein
VGGDAWLARHPEVRTVFVSALAGGLGVVATRGRSAFETAVAGYRKAWRRLISSGRQRLPVVGGAVVLKDETHLTTTFAATLGPYLVRRVDRLLAPAA